MDYSHDLPHGSLNFQAPAVFVSGSVLKASTPEHTLIITLTGEPACFNAKGQNDLVTFTIELLGRQVVSCQS